VTAATKWPRTHNIVGAGHVGAALPGTHNLVGAAHVGAAELPQGLGREQRKCLAKQQQTKQHKTQKYKNKQNKRHREQEAFQDN